MTLPRTPQLSRTLEPPPTDVRAESWLYHQMDHSEVNQRFVDDFLNPSGSPNSLPRICGPRVIDLGCGPADIAIRLCTADASIEVMAVDNETEMLEIAKVEIDMAGMLGRIQLQHADVCDMDVFADGMADAVTSNTVLHHLEDPALGIATAVRLARPGGRIFIRDLCRPNSESMVEEIVQAVAGNENDFAKQLLRQSLHASLTLDEVRGIVREVNHQGPNHQGPGNQGLGIDVACVQMTSDRHWTLDWTKPA